MPKGLPFDEKLTMEIGKLAAKTGMWSLWEWENNECKYTHIPKKCKSVSEYM